MSSRASQWPCPQLPTTALTRWRMVKSTTASGHRERTGPERLRTKLCGDRSPKQPGMCGRGSRRASAAGTCPAAHHGAHCRLRLLFAHGADSRRSCAAVCSGSSTGSRPIPSRLSKCPRFFLRTSLFAAVLRDPAAGRTAGGSADDRILFLAAADYGATRWLTFQFLVVEGEFLVFKAFSPGRVQQRCIPLKNVFLIGLWSRLLMFPMWAFKKIFAQNKVHPLLRTFQLVHKKLWMSLVKGFFRTFSRK